MPTLWISSLLGASIFCTKILALTFHEYHCKLNNIGIKSVSLAIPDPWVATCQDLSHWHKRQSKYKDLILVILAETELPSMSNHGANGNALQLSFGTLSFHIAHLHSLLFQPLSVTIDSDWPLWSRRIIHVYYWGERSLRWQVTSNNNLTVQTSFSIIDVWAKKFAEQNVFFTSCLTRNTSESKWIVFSVPKQKLMSDHINWVKPKQWPSSPKMCKKMEQKSNTSSTQ